METVTVVNEDILDDREPIIYVQRYDTTLRSYRVFRTVVDDPTAYQQVEDEVWYCFPSSLFLEPEEGLGQVVALLFAASDVPPQANQDDCDENNMPDPLVMVGWDDEEKVYCSLPTIYEGSDLEDITSPSLQAVIDTLIGCWEARRAVAGAGEGAL